MKQFFVMFLLLAAGLAGSAVAQNEQAPIISKEFEYKNWTFSNVKGEGESSLRDLAAGKKLTLVVYFAPWCPNWRHDVEFVRDLYDKYSAKGLQVVGVGEYDPLSSIQEHVAKFKLTFPIVYESALRTDKQKTTHYQYRLAAGDTRNWGSPWYVFIEPANVQPTGEVFVKKANVVNGELMRDDVEKFIREKLELDKGKPKPQASLAKADGTGPCEPAGVSNLIKP